MTKQQELDQAIQRKLSKTLNEKLSKLMTLEEQLEEQLINIIESSDLPRLIEIAQIEIAGCKNPVCDTCKRLKELISTSENEKTL